MALLLKEDKFWGIKMKQQGMKHSCYMEGEITFYLRESAAATIIIMWLKLTNIFANMEYASSDAMTAWSSFLKSKLRTLSSLAYQNNKSFL